MRRWLIRIVVIVAVIEVLYLIAANVLLNLPGTQAYINQLHPDRYVFKWDRAWSWYPFRAHATGFEANGQSWIQQWQIAAPSASASLSTIAACSMPTPSARRRKARPVDGERPRFRRRGTGVGQR